MSPKPKATSRTKVHTRYYATVDDRKKQVPGVTTILGVIAKPALIPWANKMGLKGIDTTKYVDEKAQIGTCGHYLIECHLKGVKPDTSQWAPDIVDQGENSFLKYLDWEKEHKVVSLLVEKALVSNAYQFGGTIDCFALVDGVPTLVDLKTGGGIFQDHEFQLAAYAHLLKENGHNVRNARILRIGRDEDEGFEDRTLPLLDKYWEVFLHALNIYKLTKEIKKESQ